MQCVLPIVGGVLRGLWGIAEDWPDWISVAGVLSPGSAWPAATQQGGNQTLCIYRTICMSALPAQTRQVNFVLLRLAQHHQYIPQFSKSCWKALWEISEITNQSQIERRKVERKRVQQNRYYNNHRISPGVLCSSRIDAFQKVSEGGLFSWVRFSPLIVRPRWIELSTSAKDQGRIIAR